MKMSLLDDYITYLQSESQTRSTFLIHTQAYSFKELYANGKKIEQKNLEVANDIITFSDKYPDSQITLDKFGLTDGDVIKYYKCKTARSVYNLSLQRCFTLERLDRYLSYKITNDRCEHPLLYLLLFITIGWLVLVAVAISSSQVWWGFVALPFAVVSFAFSIFLITYIFLYLITLVYNFYISLKSEKEDKKYYDNDSRTNVINNLYNLQVQYLKSSIMIPLPRITIKYLKKELQCGFSGIPSNITTEEIATEVLAITNGSLYRNGLFTPHYYDKISSNIDKIIRVTPYIDKATSILGMSNEHWKQIAHDIICIGIIRSSSRDKTDYRVEYDQSMRNEMLKMYQDTLVYALDRFGISEEEWLERGEEVLKLHNVFDRNGLMTYGYISETVTKYKFIELL